MLWAAPSDVTRPLQTLLYILEDHTQLVLHLDFSAEGELLAPPTHAANAQIILLGS